MKKLSSNHVIAFSLSIVIIALIAIKLNSYFSSKSKLRDIAELMQPREFDIVFGNDTASITAYMYTSYSCIFCRKFFEDVYPSLQTEFIDSGKLKLVMRLTVNTSDADYKNSLKAAVCINKFGHYDKMHELFLDDHRVVFTPEFRDIIDDFIQRDPMVAECILGTDSELYLDQNLKDFKENHFKGTPTFVINGKVYTGYKEYEQFKQILLKESGKEIMIKSK